MESRMKKLIWSGLLAGLSALSSFVMERAAAQVWRRVFDEEPPG
jgi:fluoride ion exporter CrcB/FEX